MTVEVRNTSIELNIPIDGGKVLEHYVVEKGKRIDPQLFGIPYRDGGALPAIVGQLRTQALTLDNGRKRFADCVADNLNAAVLALRHQEEF